MPDHGSADRAAERRPVRRALLSLSDKSGLEPFARALASAGVELISTGGTAAALRALGLAVTEVSAVTGLPEMLDGRVKTLHPAIHGAILARRDDPAHRAALEAQAIAPIDLVAVTLYPFEATVAAGARFEAAIEQIDIGGPALIRAAAKNHDDVTVLTDPADYDAVAGEIAAGGSTRATRRRLGAAAFARTAAYDAAVAAWFAAEAGERFPARATSAAARVCALRYGENPHQAAALYAGPEARAGVVSARRLQGKELSYNNLADADAAFELAAELDRFGRPAVVIVKHATPCGAALGPSVAEAHRRARACDPVSAFGGVVASNRPIDAEAARAVLEIFTEVLIAPEIDAEALALLEGKPNLRVLTTGALPDPFAPGRLWRSVAGGFLAQDRDADRLEAAELRAVTRRAPTPSEIDDLMLAWTVAKHAKSNAIVFVKDGATVGLGSGQPSRLDATRTAAAKAAEAFGAEAKARGFVVASDAFYPFPDALTLAVEAGATAAIQPGGALKDDAVIRAADDAGLAMVFTGRRHFRH